MSRLEEAQPDLQIKRHKDSLAETFEKIIAQFSAAATEKRNEIGIGDFPRPLGNLHGHPIARFATESLPKYISPP